MNQQKHFKRTELRLGLDYLMENQYIYCVGVRNRKYTYTTINIFSYIVAKNLLTMMYVQLLFHRFVTSRHMEKWSLLIDGDDTADVVSYPKRLPINLILFI